ncbi:MAG: transcription antitermination protein NusB, partial [Myxococcales bacterium]|nr:transcription antitermination protein NusB [Myxococcales bacterium]
MGARSGGREAALQMLYALDSARERPRDEEHDPRVAETADEPDVEQVIADYWREVPGDPEGRAFADGLVRDVVARLDQIDEQIRAASKHWRLERMARVDRNVLRLGVAELSASDEEVPRAVIIDEA